MNRWTGSRIGDQENQSLKGLEMAKRGFMCIVVIFSASAAIAAESPKLRLASDSWPPFTGGSEGQRIAIQLVNTALGRAGFSTETSIIDWKEVERGLRTGKFDGSAAIWKTTERERDLVFSQPYLENRLVLIGRKGSNVDAVTISDLAGKRVAAVGRYAYGDEINKADGVFFVNGRNDQDNLNKLLAKDVEYMLVDELVVRYLVASQPEEAANNLEIGTRALASRMLHFAVRKDVPGAEEIVTAFNREIREMMTDGTYIEILQVGWIRVDVDGDGLVELVALGDRVGQEPPSGVYDVFGEIPEDTPVEKQRVFIKGNIYKGWDAIPDAYKGQTSIMDMSFKRGTTLGTIKF